MADEGMVKVITALGAATAELVSMHPMKWDVRLPGGSVDRAVIGTRSEIEGYIRQCLAGAIAKSYATLAQKIADLQDRDQLSLYDDKVLALVEEVDWGELAGVLRRLAGER